MPDWFTNGQGGGGPTMPQPVGLPPGPFPPAPPMPTAPAPATPAAPASDSGTPWYQNPQTYGTILSGLGSLWGAYNQNQTNNQNFNAQQAQMQLLNARQAQVTDYVNQFLQGGQNPYSAAIMQLFGAQPAPQAPVAAPAPAATPAPTGQTGGQTGGKTGWAPFASSLNRIAVPRAGTDTNPSIPVASTQVHPSAQAGFQLPAFQAPSQISVGAYNPVLAGAQPQVVPQNVAAPQIDIAGITGGSSGFNQGQDALLQFMRSGPRLGADQQVTSGLSSLIGSQGNPYDTSGLFGALDASNRSALDQQVAALQGSFGSFGQRYGTAARGQEARLRTDMTNAANLQRQQIGMQSFNDAQTRNLQALGLAAQQQNVGNQNALAAFGAQSGLAQTLASLGLNQQQLAGQLSQSNQGAALQALLANQGAGLQAGLAGQSLAQQIALANQTAQNQGAQFNIGNSLATQQANNAAQQAWQQFVLGGIGQASAIQQAQAGQNNQLLAILAGLQPGAAPVAQPSAYPGAIQDIGQLGLLLPYLLQSRG